MKANMLMLEEYASVLRLPRHTAALRRGCQMFPLAPQV